MDSDKTRKAHLTPIDGHFKRGLGVDFQRGKALLSVCIQGTQASNLPEDEAAPNNCLDILIAPCVSIQHVACKL